METDLLKEWFQWKQDPDFYLSKKKKTQIQNLPIYVMREINS